MNRTIANRCAGANIAALLLSSTALFAPASALAQGEETVATGRDQIIVTARKREERVLDVPASLDVFQGADIQKSGARGLEDLQYNTPGLKIAVGGGSTRVSLRGVGNNLDGFGTGPSVAIHVDGVYVPQTRFALAELYDIGRVEVLKGPEGTLYGRNATGGAINIISREPGDVFGAEGYVGYGNFDLITTSLAADIPLNERGGVRISGLYANDDGYTKNIGSAGGEIDDRDYFGMRLRGRYDFTENFYGALTVQYVKDKGTVSLGGSNNPDTFNYASFFPEQRINPRKVNFDTPTRSDQEAILFSGEAGVDLGWVKLRSVTGYIDYQTDQQIEIDGAGIFIAYSQADNRSKFFSEELQASGDIEGFSWTAGLYYSKERLRAYGVEYDQDYPVVGPYIYVEQAGRTTSESFAVYGEGTIDLTDRLSFLAGGRYTRDSIDGAQTGSVLGIFPIDGSNEIANEAFTPKALLQYRPNDDAQIYLSATKGFKSGGINFGPEVTTFKPEKIWAYEIGAKTTLADDQIELGLAAFYYDYTNLQLRSAIFTSTGVTVTVNNAGKAEVFGVEGSAFARLPAGFSINASAAYLDTELNNFFSPTTAEDLSGIRLPFSPKWSTTAALQYDADLGDDSAFNARVEYTYQTGILFSQFTDLTRERQDAFGLLNASIRYDLPGGRYYVTVIGRNLADETYLTQRFYYDLFSDIEFYGRPRTVEGRIGFKL